jgi:hypothetical protein
MKIAITIAASTILFVAAGPCVAEWGISPVSPERANELGIKARSESVGRNQVQVTFEFETKGELKKFSEGVSSSDPSRVELHIGRSDKAAVIAPLREDRSTPGRIIVSFTAVRAELDKLSLRLMVAEGLGGTAFDLRVKDFVKPEKESPALTRVPLTAGDIAGVTGLNIYKFSVAMKPGTRFEIVVSVQETPDATPRVLNRHSFASDGDTDNVELLLSFLARDNALRGVLLSQDEEVNYRVECPNCNPSGIATIIALPLNQFPGTQKTLIPMTGKRSQEISRDNESCLIAILASKDGEPASLQKSYPRATISVRITD